MIETILIVDTETTGLSPAKGALMIEICAILYSVKHKQILQAYSTLLPTLTNEARHINNIDPLLTQESYDSSLDKVQLMSYFAQAIVAHNAPFDREFVKLHLPDLDRMRWICTQRDFPWPCILPRRRLQDVCNGMGVEYVDAHRALSDTMFLVNCFNKIENLQDLFNSI